MRRATVSGVVALLTDFGTRSQYVSEIKAILISELPEVRIVDISHEVGRHSIEEGAYLLYASSRWFPSGSILVGIVDPSVGTARKGLIIATSRNYYIGPDNGLLYPSVQADGEFEAFVIDEERLRGASKVFHGRDIFAKVAIDILKGNPVETIGHQVDSILGLELFSIQMGPDSIVGRILFVDDFGNMVTNIREASVLNSLPFGSLVKLRLDGKDIGTAVYTDAYGRVPEGTMILLRGSESFFEIAVNRGSAAERTGGSTGGQIEIKVPKPDWARIQ